MWAGWHSPVGLCDQVSLQQQADMSRSAVPVVLATPCTVSELKGRPMSIVRVVGGVDTHADFHVAAAVDGNGGLLGVEAVSARILAAAAQGRVILGGCVPHRPRWGCPRCRHVTPRANR
jgi:hypothetical protein